ncbi:cadherin-like beta sandwich domain-containing protein, partial [Xylanibacillus composti]|uniref:cadherin-like beta sandwich domain-containing protein n=1 Tax=Xylanibacillus composti TaxID=1572762 RepID=UPI001BCE56EF
TYTVNVGNEVTQVTVTPAVSHDAATVKVNGDAVTSGSASDPIPLNVGPNTIEVEVSAEDGTTTKTYTVTVVRAASSDADLSNLALSGGSLSPAFASSTITYTSSVGNEVNSLTVTPTVADSTATVTVNGTAVTSGSASDPIPLSVGDNPITVVVTAEDGTTKTYTVTVTRAASSNADLSNLTLSAGSLSPAFASGTILYTSSVGNEVNSLTVTPTVADSTATVTVNGTAVTSGSASDPIPLNVGPNTIEVEVTAEDGTTTKTYTVTVTRAANSNANLANLELSHGTLDPVFESSKNTYTANVGNDVAVLAVTPTVEAATSTITVNGLPVASGASQTVELEPGLNRLTVKVTAEDGTSKDYEIDIRRYSSLLNGLALSEGSLSPGFDPATASYQVSVTNSVYAVIVTPLPMDDTADIKVNGMTPTNGSVQVPLDVGTNKITVEVTALDLSSSLYTIQIKRFSIDASLSSLTIHSGTLAPDFTPTVMHYSATVTNDVYALNVTPTAANLNAVITVNAAPVTSGSAIAVPLEVGNNTITIAVVSEDGTTDEIYTLVVAREALRTVADLSALTVNSGALEPAFDPLHTEYSVTVESSVTSIAVTPAAADEKSSITINGQLADSGQPSAAIPLAYGSDNQVIIRVTAEDGSSKTYRITVTRRPLSHNANLIGITLSSGTLTPAFTPDQTTYSATVANRVTEVTITASAEDAEAAVSIDGEPAATGSQAVTVPVHVGRNKFDIVVTARDGSVREYELDIWRNNRAGNTPGGSNSPSSSSSDDFELGTIVRDTAPNGQSRITVILDPDKLGEKLQNEGRNAPILIRISEAVDQVVTQLDGANLQLMQSLQAELRIQTETATYTLPMHHLILDQAMSDIQAHMSFEVTIASLTEGEAEQVKAYADQANLTPLIFPVSFSIALADGEERTGVAQFHAYVTRRLVVPDEVDPGKITTGVIVLPNGTFHHVPTKVVQQDGKYYAEINSLTNSAYTLIYNEATFEDAQHHWSREIVNESASRLIVSGKSATSFDPNSPVTRAEFAAMLNRALGLSQTTKQPSFRDVPRTAWYYEPVAIGEEYGLLSGFEDQTFKPRATITREEAMVMMSHAMKLVGLSGPAPEQMDTVLGQFRDSSQISAWARAAAAACVDAKIVRGSHQQLAPKSNLTRAEAATMIMGLLEAADLI